MEKHLSHDFKPPPQTHWKKVRKLDFAQKPRGGWKDEERKKERWEKGWLDKWEAVHTNKGCYVAFAQVLQSYRTVQCMPLKRGNMTRGWVVTLIYSDREAFMTEPCDGMEFVSECDGWLWSAVTHISSEQSNVGLKHTSAGTSGSGGGASWLEIRGWC